MTESISLDQALAITGIANIQISRVDHTVYVANTVSVEPSTQGSLAMYTSDDQPRLAGTGPLCVWDKTAGSLRVAKIESKQMDTEQLAVSDLVIKNYTAAEKLMVNRWLAIRSQTQENPDQYMITINSRGSLTVTQSATGQQIMSVDQQRLRLPVRLNLECQVPSSALGQQKDRRGDMASDQDWLYYCAEDWSGDRSIWRRVRWESWQ